jgi:large subunit ribosomal protein L25
VAGIVLTVERRDRTGGGSARQTRARAKIPGILYGGPRGSVPIELDSKELTKALRSGKFVSHMIEISHQGERQPVIPRAIQYDPVTDLPIHLDLYRVEEGAVLTVEVPVHFKNQEASPGMKRGGVLNIVLHTISLSCPADKIPEELVVDLDGAEIGAVFHASALVLPAGVKLAAKDRDLTVATIGGRAAEEEEAPKAEGEAAPAEGAKSE